MAYQKQTFIDMETIATAEQMNHIEDGIVQNESDISANAADIKANKNNIATLTSDLATQEKTVQQNTSDIQQNTSDISELNSALADKIEVTLERYEHTSTTIAGGSSQTISIPYTARSGYSLIAVVCTVTGANQLCPTSCGVSGSDIEVRLRNTSDSSSVTTSAEWFLMFWQKS